MSLDSTIGSNLISSVLYDLLVSGVGALRRRRHEHQWATELAGEVRRFGATLSDVEAMRFARWVTTWPVDQLATADSGGSEDLARTLSIEVFGVGNYRNAPTGVDLTTWADEQTRQAERLASAVWPALNVVLGPDEHASIRTALSARHTEELTTSVLEQLDWLKDEVGELSRLLTPTLPLERARLRPRSGFHLTPYEMLWPRFAVVPFDDHDNRLSELVAWCESADRVSVQIVSGAGGMGKTRLGLELCRHMAERCWLAGVFRPRGEAAINALVSEKLPRLVVVDYAEDDPVAVHRLVGRLSENLPLRAHRIRVLLLVRRHIHSGDERRIFAGNQDDAAHLIGERAPILIYEPKGGEASVLSREKRERLFDAAVEAFCARAGLPGRAVEVPDLGSDSYNSPLFVSAAAFLAVEGDGAGPTGFSSSDQLMERLVEHEQMTHWRTCPESDPEIQRRVVATATLFGADNETEMSTHLEAVLGLGGDDSRAQRHRIALWLHRLYSGERWVNPLEPDLLGEALVRPYLDSELLNRALTLGASLSGVRALNVLTRISATDEDLRRRVGSQLEMHLSRLFDVAVQQEVSASLWGQRGLLAEALSALLDVTGLSSPPWPESPAAVGPACLTLALQFDRHAVAAYRHLASIEPDRYNSDLATALNALGVDLGSSGQPDEALAVMIEAVAIRRQLLASGPDSLGQLSMSLNNLAVRYGARGYPAEALEAIEEAVTIRRALVRERPAEFLPKLARSLSNYSQRLASVKGREEEALKAILEAVDIRTRLDDEEPDRHRADLATSLGGLSGRLSDFGRLEEALVTMQRAVAIRRELAALQPATYLPNLATSLFSLCERCRDLDYRFDALAAIDEAVKIRRQLFEIRPDVYRVRFVSALTLLADSLEATNNLEHHSTAEVVRAEVRALARPEGPTEEFERSMNSYPAVDRTS